MKDIQLLETKDFFIKKTDIIKKSLEKVNDFKPCFYYLDLKSGYSMFNIKDIYFLTQNAEICVEVSFNDFDRKVVLKIDKIDDSLLKQSKFEIVAYSSGVKMKKNEYSKIKNYFYKNKKVDNFII